MRKAAYQLADTGTGARPRPRGAQRASRNFSSSAIRHRICCCWAWRASRTLGDDTQRCASITKILRADFPNSEQVRSLGADPQPNPVDVDE